MLNIPPINVADIPVNAWLPAKYLPNFNSAILARKISIYVGGTDWTLPVEGEELYEKREFVLLNTGPNAEWTVEPSMNVWKRII